MSAHDNPPINKSIILEAANENNLLPTLEPSNDNSGIEYFEVPGFGEQESIIDFKKRVADWVGVEYMTSFDFTGNYEWDPANLKENSYKIVAIKIKEDASAESFAENFNFQDDTSKIIPMSPVLIYRVLDNWFKNLETNYLNILNSSQTGSNVFWIEVEGKKLFVEVSFDDEKIKIWALPDTLITPRHKFFCSVE